MSNNKRPGWIAPYILSGTVLLMAATGAGIQGNKSESKCKLIPLSGTIYSKNFYDDSTKYELGMRLDNGRRASFYSYGADARYIDMMVHEQDKLNFNIFEPGCSNFYPDNYLLPCNIVSIDHKIN